MPHPNEDKLRKIDEAQARGDLEAFFGSFTDDVKVHVQGKSKLAGEYEGKDNLQALFGRFMEAAVDVTFEAHAYLADDEHGVTLQKGTYRRGGQTLELDEAFVVHFRDGKVSEMWYLTTDQQAFDAWIG
jgi:ketosteroid isomerase-like protein